MVESSPAFSMIKLSHDTTLVVHFGPSGLKFTRMQKIYIVMSRLCHCVLILTEEFADDLGSCLSWEKSTVPCL
jgi:hypothetical protein